MHYPNTNFSEEQVLNAGERRQGLHKHYLDLVVHHVRCAARDAMLAHDACDLVSDRTQLAQLTELLDWWLRLLVAKIAKEDPHAN